LGYAALCMFMVCSRLMALAVDAVALDQPNAISLLMRGKKEGMAFDHKPDWNGS